MRLRQRNGSTLAEVLISVGAGSMLFLLAVELVHQSFQTSSKSRVRSDHSNSVERFAQQFRLDAHRVSRVTEHANDSVVFGSGSVDNEQYSISYVAKPGCVTREEVSPGKTTHRDIYRFARGTEVRFEFDTDSRLVKSTIENHSQDSSLPTKVELEVTGRVGAWLTKESIVSNEVKP